MNFIANLDQHHKMILLLAGLQLSFDNITTNSKRLVAAAVGKNYKVCTEKFHELGGSMVNQLTSWC